MNLWWKALAARYRNPARELALIGVERRAILARNAHERVLAVARQMRADAGLPPHKALEA